MIRPFEIMLRSYRAIFLSKRQMDQMFQMIYTSKVANNSYDTLVLQLSLPLKFHLYSYPSMVLAIQVI